MKLSNVKLIFAREVRDQLRDRRTLFMIAVLPILLYPLLGMSLLQVAQFMREQPTRVLVVGADKLTGRPALFEDRQFSPQWVARAGGGRLLDAFFAPRDPHGKETAFSRDQAAALVQKGDFEAAICFPPDFAQRLTAFRKAIADRAGKGGRDEARSPVREVPSPEIIYNAASDKSQLAFARLSDVLRRWTEGIGEENLKAGGISTRAARPVSVVAADVATPERRGNAMWSKILPVLLLLWALTGAFYPAIDLCAGEKERGTLETLLSSPAQRSEIVVGKLLTVMLFSVATAVLNLASMGLTGSLVLAKMTVFGLPSPLAVVALLAALVPMAALFSALCVALAAFARSTKEGQYYLMPLLLVSLPLVILPMSPGVELNLGNSLIPVTGVVLVLRDVLEGNGWQALQFAPVVAIVTLAACLMAIRWAVDQFNSESVLFRESERLEPWLRLRRLLENRQPTPTVAMALVCGSLLLVADFFLSFSQRMPTDFGSLVRTFLTPQLAVFAPAALLLAFFLTSSPRQTLLLRRPAWLAIPAAALLAVVLHPAINCLQVLVTRLYPVSESVQPGLMQIQKLLHQANVWPLLLIIAVAPAVCEELAFRGFILSGFRSVGHKWRAIVFTAALFGIAHGVLQQSLIASLLGVVLGYLAVQTGSIFPCMVFHACNNALAVVNSRVVPEMLSNIPAARALVSVGDQGGCTFHWTVVVAGALAAVLLLGWFRRLTDSPSASAADGGVVLGGQAVAGVNG